LKNPYARFLSLKESLYKRLFGKVYLSDRAPLLLRSYARQVKAKLAKIRADIVFSPGTIPIAYLECKQPIVFWTDSTFGGMVNFYPEFSDLCRGTIKNGNALEQAALDRCTMAIYASDWAAKSAKNLYSTDPKKLDVIPFGANMECNRSFQDIKNLVDSRTREKCKLLFVGMDWARKGGEIVLKVAQSLNENGLNTELKIVGCKPNFQAKKPDFVQVLGFVNKNTKEGSNLLNNLFGESHFLILPSKAEAYGVVFCESNSFGVPCIASDVGGIPTVIKKEVNGNLFSPAASIDEYCSYIMDLLSDYAKYRSLALSSFHEYKTRLNWQTSGTVLKKLLTKIMHSKHTHVLSPLW